MTPNEDHSIVALQRLSIYQRTIPLSTPDDFRPGARSSERSVREADDHDEEVADKIQIPCKLTRVDSDPLDSTGGPTDIRANSIPQDARNSKEAQNHNLPNHLRTLPRFPIAENKNRNCWSEPYAGKSFKVRGANYLSDKKKIFSGPYMFSARGADLIVTDQKSPPGINIASNHSILAGHARSEPTFILNFVFPWGVLVNYYEIPPFYVAFLQKYERGEAIHNELLECLAPHERTMIRFLTGNDNYRQSKLKLIPVCIEGPWAVKQLIAGKPAIIGKRLPVEYKYHSADHSLGLAECFEVDLDVSASDPLGKKVVKMCRSYMTQVTVDIGVVIEGLEDDELPEQMLGCVRLHKLDALLAPTLA